MKERIKRVGKGYWLIVFLWLASLPREMNALTFLAGAVIAGYLIYTMWGDETNDHL